MAKKILSVIAGIACVFVLSACSTKTPGTNTQTSGIDQTPGSSTREVTQRTDYTIFYQETSPIIVGAIQTHTYIVGHPVADAGTIKYNAYFVPWRIDFSQVQRISNAFPGCETIKEQVVYIEGWIDLNLADMEINATNIPNDGPAKPTGTVHETVTGEAGTWRCSSDLATRAANEGSIQSVQNVSGEHTANFADASNLTGLTVSGATIYLDLSMPEDVQFIWPAGTKIEYAPEGTPIPLEPLAPSKL